MKHLPSLISLSLVAVLIAPYLILISFVPGHAFSWPEQAGHVIVFTFMQALLSVLASLALGVLVAAGLLSCRRSRGVFEVLALALNALPILFVITGVLNFWPALSGLWGIVFLHTLLNIGLVGVSLSRLWTQKLGRLSELAFVEGASRWQFIRAGVGKLLVRDLAIVGFFVFILCWTSFAVPLLVGGSRATTFEVLIYENIQKFATWPQALWLSFAQTLFLLVISGVLPKSKSAPATRSSRLPHLEWAPGLLLALGPIALIGTSLASGLLKNWQTIELQMMASDLSRPLLASCGVALVTGSLTLTVLLFVAAIRPQAALRKFLIGYLSPGAVLTGFALLVVWRAMGVATFFKISIGLTLLFLPAFYRLSWDSLLETLSGQVTVAQSLGASRGLIFFDIVVPQVWSQACRFAGLAAIWAWGDFALSSVVSERDVTLALVVRGWLGAYRVESATALVWIILLGAGVTYLIFEGLSYVGRPRS